MSDTMKRRWFLTINNPSETDDEFADYVQKLEHFKYCAFQREKGEEKETIHFQVFLIFNVGKRFSTLKNYFPTAHIEPVQGTNAQARDYCTKCDTRISGPYELGSFAEERSRTDISNFIELVQNGASELELAKLFPKLYLSNLNKIEKIRSDYLSFEFLIKNRNVEVTYIYGPPRTGKTRYVYDKYGFGKFYHASVYNNSTFDNYKNEDILVLDEFSGQFKIELMNRLLDVYPFMLPARYANKVACYTKVYIISNLPLNEIYKDEQRNKPIIFNAFNERIKTILRIDKTGSYVERENYKDLYRSDLIKLNKEEEKMLKEEIDNIF